ncbi:hypothetical protein DSUL_20224 [Desulfovibrionales bacterium]
MSILKNTTIYPLLHRYCCLKFSYSLNLKFHRIAYIHSIRYLHHLQYRRMSPVSDPICPVVH